MHGNNEQCAGEIRETRRGASITKPSNRYQPLESAAPIAAKSLPTCEVSALQTFSRTIIRVARLSTLNAFMFISSRRARTSRTWSPFEPDAGAGRVLATERLPGEIGVARQIGGGHLATSQARKCSLPQFGAQLAAFFGSKSLGQATQRVMPPHAKNSRNSNMAAPDEPRRSALNHKWFIRFNDFQIRH